jgi:dynein heavy chain
MIDPKKMNNKEQLARLWVHENKRVFADRLTCEEDHEWSIVFIYIFTFA